MPRTKTTSIQGNEESRTGSQTVDRAAELLRLVCSSRALGIALSDVVRMSGLAKPTARRLLLSLINNGLVEQHPENRKYYAGSGIYALGVFASERFSVLRLAGESLVRLATASGDSCLLSIPRAFETVCLAREEGSYPLKSHVLQPGHRHPLGCGAPGVALLMPRSDVDIETALRANAPALKAQYPGVTPEVVRYQVRQARKLGYALNQGLIFPGSWGVAVPVLDAHGQVCAALGIAGVEIRFTKPRIAELARLLTGEREELERKLKVLQGPARRA